MSQSQQATHKPWLELSEAAEFLGVHFTTLRRWADAGDVPCIRTPGGRRRFQRDELVAFLESLRQGNKRALATIESTNHPMSMSAVKHNGIKQEPWYGRLDESLRRQMRREGQRLMAVLMQYATRSDGGEIFLQEGERFAAFYGQACYENGLSLVETSRAFLLVRRSIKDSVYQAGALAGAPDQDTWRLYNRMNTFLDTMLLSTLAAYDQAQKRDADPRANDVRHKDTRTLP